MTVSGYFYAALWLAIAAYMVFLAVKESRFFILLALFFLFMGGWSAANELTEMDLYAGAYGWIFRGISAVVLVICVIRYVLFKKNQQ